MSIDYSWLGAGVFGSASYAVAKVAFMLGANEEINMRTSRIIAWCLLTTIAGAGPGAFLPHFLSGRVFVKEVPASALAFIIGVSSVKLLLLMDETITSLARKKLNHEFERFQNDVEINNLHRSLRSKRSDDHK